jgi:DNA polymerase-3 subunit epsilon
LSANSEGSIYDHEFCALDIETTGINPFAARLIEIGLAVFTVDKKIATYQTLVNPGVHIPEQVTAIHGITDEMVYNAPLFPDIIDQVIAFIGNRPLVIHNCRFDLSFIEMECKRIDKRIPAWISFDTVILARKSFPNLPNHKLDTLCASFGVDLSHHRALDDAVGCSEVFSRCILEVDRNRQWSFASLLDYHSRVTRSGFIREIDSKERHGSIISVGKQVTIRYIDAEGNATERRILPKKIFKKGKQTVVYAHCYLRDEDRYFNTARIEKVTPL